MKPSWVNINEIQSTIDYYPFGMEMPGRVSNASAYRFGFNGKENDNEIAGTGSWQNYGMREYDTRIARFISVDPLTKKYPELTPYQFTSNRPIDGTDLDGGEWQIAIPAAVAATEAALIATGVVTAGVIIQKSQSGDFQLTPEAKVTLKSLQQDPTGTSATLLWGTVAYAHLYTKLKENPGFKQQKNKEKEAEQKANEDAIAIKKGIDNNLSNTPLGGRPDPNRMPDNKVGIIVGGAIAVGVSTHRILGPILEQNKAAEQNNTEKAKKKSTNCMNNNNASSSGSYTIDYTKSTSSGSLY